MTHAEPQRRAGENGHPLLRCECVPVFHLGVAFLLLFCLVRFLLGVARARIPSRESV